MSVAFEADRPVLAVPHIDLRLADGRQLRLWEPSDPRRRQAWSPGMLDLDGWTGPKRLIVICSLDTDRLGALLHVSMSYPDRDPPWSDIKLIREAFFPVDDVDVMMMLPRRSMYVAGVPDPRVGLDSHVFHLQQTPEAWGRR